MSVLDVKDLTIHIGDTKSPAHAVDSVSLHIERGEVVALVGESGSGKTLTGLAIAGLLDPPLRRVGGEITLLGEDLSALPERQLRRRRGDRLAMVFQDPMATLNPVLRIETQLVETIRAHRNVGRSAARDEALAMLDEVGITFPAQRLRAYPHELSGGMRQRVAIAAALINQPALLIADEPTTALDVTLQAQILALIDQYRRDHGTAVLWITHDLGVAAGFADRVLVMYAGQIVESGPCARVLHAPAHPYTAALLGAIPGSVPPGTPLATLPGQPPSLSPPPEGCRFRARCPRAEAACIAAPPQVAAGEARTVRCFFPLVTPP
ncbi:ABC transporter ATP-binding protein [Jeongeupia naejangsanensis]|uniref:ABC transporter ATP-binding protein n=1 Tax=Jeongeupia naejangsanensis TaxID=613195 RepID=A0ABS2BH23_9NEIS|nr:ABC transporter ATP-binding protein [Jeongeupia naejangsanensis]MBM3114901.1 ABC transporter ATP-binding protein [Jeongeupia naejangsanensis]